MSADPASETAAAPESAPKRARGRERERRIDRRSLLRPGDGPMVVFDKVVKRYAPTTKPEDIASDVEALLRSR